MTVRKNLFSDQKKKERIYSRIMIISVSYDSWNRNKIERVMHQSLTDER